MRYFLLLCSIVLLGCQSTSNEAEAPAVDSLLLTDTTSLHIENYDGPSSFWSLDEALVVDPKRVLQLRLEDENLQRLPHQLEDFVNLQRLDVRGNPIKTIPKYLASLQELDISSSSITNLPHGFEQLTSLKKLYIDHNALNSFPRILLHLPLEDLFLGHTGISELPEDIGQMTTLKSLSLWDNNMTELPTSIGNLQQLEMLSLSDNGIGELPESFAQLQNLKSLYMGSEYSGGGNGHSFDALPEAILQLTSLETLNLSYGYLISIPPEIAQLTQLKSLDLSGNDLSELPEAIKVLKHMEYLYLGGNNFSQETQEEIRSWFPENVIIEFEEIVGC